jgi:hypothetical protein
MVSKPLRLIPVSQDSRIRYDRWQHLLIFEPVDILWIVLVRANILAPGVVGVSANAVYCDDTVRCLAMERNGRYHSALDDLRVTGRGLVEDL